jgi:hypothetical protein
MNLSLHKFCHLPVVPNYPLLLPLPSSLGQISYPPLLLTLLELILENKPVIYVSVGLINAAWSYYQGLEYAELYLSILYLIPVVLTQWGKLTSLGARASMDHIRFLSALQGQTKI